MATHSAVDLNSKPLSMGNFGNANVVWGTVTPTAGTLASVFRPVRIPAGFTVLGLRLHNPDMDTGGTAFAVTVGYTPVDAVAGPTADPDYFSAATTQLSAVGDSSYRFPPIKFEKDVFVDIIVSTAATTFAAGDITVIVTGEATGVK